MSPGHLRRRWRDFGPWTDLCAVGCTAWTLATGRPVFAGLPQDELAPAHLGRPPPPFPATRTNPRGFPAWLHRLLAKDPGQRFVRAADAAWTLAELTAPAASQGIRRAGPADAEAPTELALAAIGRAGSQTEASPRPEIAPPATVPEQWRRPTPTLAPPPLVGCGLQLYGLRAHPFVGRDAQRQQLWDALRSVARTQRPATVVLRGSGGVGKSRLARWLVERAEEVGAAQTLYILCSSAADDLALLVRKDCGAVGLQGAALLARVRRHLRRYGADSTDEASALAQLVAGRPGGPGPGERRVLLTRLLQRRSATRPFILCLDDIHQNAQFLETIGGALTSHLPVLFLIVGRDEDLAQNPRLGTRLRELSRAPLGQTLALGPLPRDEHHALVRGLLPLSTATALMITDRTAGNPLFAVQLVADWVDRDLLELGPYGFRPPPGAEVPLPADLQELWAAHVERFLQERRHEDRLALEMAAVLGASFDAREWREACKSEGFEASSDFLSVLRIRRLVLREERHRWSLVHPMFRETILSQARSAGRFSGHHHTAAQVLMRRHGLGVTERTARHLVAAGQHARAISPLLSVAKSRAERSDFGQANVLIAACRASLEAVPVPNRDPRWGSLRLLELATDAVLHREGRMQRIDSLVRDARRHRWREISYRVLLRKSGLLRRRAQFHDARRALQDARCSASSTSARAHCDVIEGFLHIDQGAFDTAKTVIDRALRCPSLEPEQRTLGIHGLGDIAFQRGGFAGAGALYAKAAKELQEQGRRFEGAICELSLGEVERLHGRLEVAEAHYQRHRLLRELLGSYDESLEFNIALIRIEQGRFEEAAAILEKTLHIDKMQGHRGYLGAQHVFILPCAADARDWDGWDTHMQLAESLLQTTGFVDRDIARCAELAAKIAMGRGERARALRAATLGAQQYRMLGCPKDARRLLRLVS